ncbi:hypothetical protein EIP91_008706 [Steccherinum ochraceum]|uniref:MYND-type domain-containing protein n=1 Tax=Steccherinum ochraceum TaxID=92696 RepID=A0A4V2MV68_9APHY|nr:hypothetical protein EIP91_008706 [Steccherinum ochraceum]
MLDLYGHLLRDLATNIKTGKMAGYEVADPREAPLPVGPGIGLPPFAEVRAEVARLSETRRQNVELSSSDYANQFPKLFAFCLYVEMADVPDDMMDDIVFISKAFLRYLSEDESDVFSRNPGIQYEMSEMIRMKRVTWLTTDIINRPEEALEEVETQMREWGRRPRQYAALRDKPWIEGVALYSRYGDMLILCNKFDEDTRTAIQHLLESAAHPANTNTPNIVLYGAMAAMHMALLLEVLDMKGDAQDRHLSVAARYFRKNRTAMRHVADLFLKRPGQPVHPVYLALGEEWFTNRPTLRDEKHSLKFCLYCSKTEFKATLFRCARCQIVYYCSKDCQKADWKTHKSTCQASAEDQKLVEEMRKKHGPQIGQQAADVVRWRNSQHYANLEALIHALGLRRDPTRSRTHIVIRSVEGVPGPRARDFRDRVRVAQWSVYKIEDVLEDITKYQGTHRGNNKREAYNGIQKMLNELLQEGPDGKPLPGIPPKRFKRLAMMDLTIGPGIRPYVNAIAISENYVRTLKYEPDWRQHINGSTAPPEPFVVLGGADDAEHVF